MPEFWRSWASAMADKAPHVRTAKRDTRGAARAELQMRRKHMLAALVRRLAAHALQLLFAIARCTHVLNPLLYVMPPPENPTSTGCDARSSSRTQADQHARRAVREY
jgi:hypothetical protein